MTKPVIPPAGLSGLESMIWIRDAGCTVALNHPTQRRYLWKLSVFEPLSSKALAATWQEYNVTRYAFRLPPVVIVIDVDGENAAERWREMQARFKVKNTRIIRTPSGGLHVYLYRDPDTPIRHGVNVLADHGFQACDVFTKNSALITGPGSYRRETAKKCAGVYRWVTPQKDLARVTPTLAEALKPPPVPEVEYAPPREFVGHIDKGAQAAFDDECNIVAIMGDGGRTDRLFKASAALGNFVGAGRLPEGEAKRGLYAAAVACGLVADEGQHYVQTQIRNGIALGRKTPRADRPLTRGSAHG